MTDWLPLVLLLVVGSLQGLTANIVKLTVAAGWSPSGLLFFAPGGSPALYS